MRMFTAIPIPAAVAAPIAEWVQIHRHSLPFRKWTYPADYHLTLQFLGEVSEEQLEALHRALQTIRFAPLSLALNRGETFGQPHAPRVLFNKVTGELDSLRTLYASVLTATEPLGFQAEARPYSPHLTIARSYSADARLPFPRELLDSMPSGSEWTADRFVLMRTHMHSSPMYEAVYEYF